MKLNRQAPKLGDYTPIFLIVTILLSSCSSISQNNSGNSQRREQILSSTPPFKTKEPQSYQAIRTVTLTDPSGRFTETKTILARSEIRRREETQVGDATIVFLESDKGRFVLLPESRIYTEAMNSALPGQGEVENSPERLLHPGTLETAYQDLGSEIAAGRKTTKYRAVVNNSAAPNVTPCETLIWVDETLGMPIRSETTASDGSRVVMELSHIVLGTDENLFRIPEGFAKVDTIEFRRRLNEKQAR